MRITTVFNMLLNLQATSVQSVTFDFDTIEVAVRPKALKHRCPGCQYATWGSYDSSERCWRHVALGKWRIVLGYRICRLVCPVHGVVTEAVPWADPGSRFTRDFEDLVAWTSRTMDRTAVSTLLHVSWATIGPIIERVVARSLDADRLNNLYFIGVDEVSYRKGHKYLTVIADHLSGDAVFITPGRTREAVGRFFDQIGPKQAEEVAGVTMDMAAPYIEEVQQRAPIRLGLSNGRLEGINNKIGVIKRRAYGFHSPGALIAMIYLCCSNLPINLPI